MENVNPEIYYEYRAICLRIIDGDTLELKLEIGFGLSFVDRFRLYGIDTAETHGKKSKIAEEKALGLKAVVFIKTLLFPDKINSAPLRVETIKDKKDKYGRYLAKVFVEKDGNDICINDALLKEGLAVPFMV